MSGFLGTSRRIAARLPVNVAEFGAKFNGADDTKAVQSAIDAALLRGASRVQIDRNVICAGPLANRSKVAFVGEGALAGDGAYRRQVTRGNDPSTAPRFTDLSPRRHMPIFSAMRKPVVVLAGSSTGTWQPNTVDAVSSLPHMLSARLSKFNPEKQIAFFNRAIGGQTFDTLNSVSTVFPAWYTDQAKPWLDYVKELAPDVVFLVMGSNDQRNILHASLVSVVNKIKAFPKVPNIVFITQPSVCLDPDPAFAAFGTKADQEGRDFAAGLVRSFALYEGYGLIDGNRMGGIVMDGRDLLDTAARRVVSYLNLPTGEYLPVVPCHDFSMRLRFNGDAAAIAAAFPPTAQSSNPVSVRIGAGASPAGNPWGGDIMFIMRDARGKFQFELFSRGVTLYKAIDTNIDFPTSSFSLDIAKNGSEITVSVSGNEDNMRMVFPVKVHGGEFIPRIGHYGLNSGPFQQLEHYNVGEPKRYVPALTGIEAWGAPNPGATTALPYGGNGVNHFSSVGTRAIFAPLLDELSLTAPHADSGRYIPTFSNPVNLKSYAVDADACLWTRVGDLVTVSGKVTLAGTANGNASLDMSLPIPTDLKTSNGVNGLANANVVGGMTGAFYANDLDDTARMQLSITNLASQNVRFYFTYEIVR